MVAYIAGTDSGLEVHLHVHVMPANTRHIERIYEMRCLTDTHLTSQITNSMSASHDGRETSTDENRGHLSKHCFIHVDIEIRVEITKQIRCAQFRYAEVNLNICSLIVWHVSSTSLLMNA